ncbi:hypothetical protein R50072_28240 [Simiduia litorea]|uniref:bactofilin family protein n=1 Tax=Simiduia litorea TaxID=1435348 RepID=UPI0036F36EF9
MGNFVVTGLVIAVVIIIFLIQRRSAVAHQSGQMSLIAKNLILTSDKALFDGSICIEGKIAQDLEFSGVGAGYVFVYKTGVVEGSIKCQSINVAGYVAGDISASEMVTLASGHKIDGKINSPKIVYEK